MSCKLPRSLRLGVFFLGFGLGAVTVHCTECVGLRRCPNRSRATCKVSDLSELRARMALLALLRWARLQTSHTDGVLGV